MAGYTYSYGAGSADMYMIKIDENGNVYWTRAYGGTGIDKGVAMKQTIDGGYIITGNTNSYGAGESEIWLLKTNTHGNFSWMRTYSPDVPVWPDVWTSSSVQQTTDSGYVITGTSAHFVGASNVLCIRTNSVGDTVWTRECAAGVYDEGRSVIETSDSCYIIVGETFVPVEDNLYLVKIDASGNTMWSTTLGTGEESGSAIQQTSDNGYIIIGTTNRYSTSDVWLLKTEPDMGIVESECVVFKPQEQGATIVGGPLRLSQNKDIRVFDVNGRQVYSLNPAPGIYFIESEGEIISKVIKIR
jgi:hypothetical protein